MFWNHSGVTLTNHYLCCLSVNHSGDQELVQMQKKTNNIILQQIDSLLGKYRAQMPTKLFIVQTLITLYNKCNCCLPATFCRDLAKNWQRKSKTIEKLEESSFEQWQKCKQQKGKSSSHTIAYMRDYQYFFLSAYPTANHIVRFGQPIRASPPSQRVVCMTPYQTHGLPNGRMNEYWSLNKI